MRQSYRECASGYRAVVLAAAVGAMGLVSSAARGQAYTWDASGANPAAPTDGGGTWGAGAANWTNGGAADVAWPNDGSDAVIGSGTGAAGTMTVVSPVTVGNVTFNPALSGSYAVTGPAGSLTLNNPTTVMTANASFTTFTAGMTGTGGLTKTGTGALSIFSSNTFAGALGINQGTLDVNFASSQTPLAGITSIALSNSTILGTTLINSNLQQTAPTLLLRNAGTALGASVATGIPISVSFPAAFDAGNPTPDFRVGIGGGNAGGVSNTVFGRITASGTSYGSVVINPIALSTGGANFYGGLNATGMSAGGRLVLAGANIMTFAGQITAAGSFDVVVARANNTAGVALGNSSFVFTNTWGRTIIESGIVSLGYNNVIPTASVVTLGSATSGIGATFNLGARSQTIGGLISVAGTGGTLSVNALSTNASDTLTINTAAGTTYSYGAGNATIVATGTNATLNVTKTGAGTQIFTTANTYNGATNVNGGTLSLGISNALPTAGATALIKVGAGTLDLGTFDQTTANAVSVATGAINGTTGVMTAASYAFTNSGSASAILAGAAAPLTKTGTGAVTLTGANTYGGMTTVSAGSLTLGKDAWGPVTTGAGADVQNAGVLVFDYTGTTTPAEVVRTKIAGGTIKSTVPAADGLHTVGYLDDGTSKVTVERAYYGDLNLDGKVNGDDYALMDRGAAMGANGWVNGDVNYDGVVNDADYLLVDTVYGTSGVPHEAFATLVAGREAQFGEAYVSQLVAAVPEPGVIGLVGMGLMAGTLRRRRGLA